MKSRIHYIIIFIITLILSQEGYSQALTLVSVAKTNETCPALNNGSITITISGGVSPYFYYVIRSGITITSPETTSLSYTFINLEAGTYVIVVEDKGGASLTDITTITQPAQIAAGVNGSSVLALNCFGDVNGSINISPSGGTAPYVFSWTGPSGYTSSAEDISSLSAGTYSLSITDANSCSQSFPNIATITQPAIVGLSFSKSDITCNGLSDGEIHATGSGGTPAYTFTLNPGGFTNGTGDFTGLGLNNYTLSVSDSKGCTPASANISITQPAPIAAVVNASSVLALNCFNDTNGSVNITVSAGTAPYTFSWTGPSGYTSSFEDISLLGAGSYNLNITDSKSCSQNFPAIAAITQPAQIAASVDGSSLLTLDCFGDVNGSINITPSGGTSPYTGFSWTGPSGFTSSAEDISALRAGSYSLTIADTKSCTRIFSDIATITQPPQIAASVDVTSVLALNCFNDANGSVNITVSGGTFPYTGFSWTGPSGFTAATEDLIALSAGSYSLSITDTKLCVRNFPNLATITQPVPIAASVDASSVLVLNCLNDPIGSINITVSAGTPPYVFSWTGPSGYTASTEDINSLSAGSYSLSITDSKLCTQNFPNIATISQPPPIAASVDGSSVLALNCFNGSNGTINITVSGGTSPFVFSWTGPSGYTASTEDISSLTAGTYSLTITDAELCTKNFPNIATITQPGPIAASVDGTSVLTLICYNDASGSIKITVSGGASPYVFSWTGPSGYTGSTEDISSLNAGSYNLSITDSKSCTRIFSNIATITEPPQLGFSTSKTDISCNGLADGTVTISAIGGTPGYTYSKNDIIYVGTSVFTGLTKNNYTFYVKDSKGCKTSNTVSIDEPPDLQITSESRIDNNLCFGDSLGEIRILTVSGGIAPYEYSVNGGVSYFASPIFQGLPAGSYQSVVKDANGCTDLGNINVINEPSKIFINSYAQLDVTGCFESPNGQIAIEASGGTGAKTYTLDGTVSNTTGNFVGVLGGLHNINITDANNCTKDTAVTLNRPVKLLFSSLTLTNITGCSGDSNGAINAIASGGTGAYQFALDGGIFQASGNFSGLTAGNHTVSVKDANTCQFDSLVNLTEPQPVSITNSVVNDAVCAGSGTGSISISITGGTAPITYTLNPGAVATNNTGIFTSLAAGNYTVNINDINGCGTVTSTVLTVSQPPAILINSVVTNQISCVGNNNAVIQINASGGTSPFIYSIDDEVNYVANNNFNGLSPGTYYLSLKDANNCIVYIDTLSFADPAPITTVSETKVDITSCFNASTGEVTFVASGGTGTLEYSRDLLSWQASGNFTGLTAGSYQVTARDDNNCSLTSSFITILQPATIAATITSTPYIDELTKGTITISGATGGTGLLSYSITGAGGTFSSSTFYGNLAAGIYPVVIKDANGCTIQQNEVIPWTPPLNVTVTITQATCNGSNDAGITLTATNGVGSVQYSIDDSASWSPSGVFDLLGPGTYYVFARDADMRYFRDTLILSDPVALNIISNVTPATCSYMSSDGAIDITVVGGTGTKTYIWSTGAETEDLTGLSVGDYTIHAADQNNCSISETISVTSITVVTADAGRDTILCFGEGIILNGKGGSTLSWSPVTGLSNPNIANPVIESVTENISYELTVAGLNSCFDVDTISISVRPEHELNAGNDTSILKNSTASLQATGDIFISYSWSPVTGLSSPSNATTNASPSITTPYVLTAVDEFGCNKRDTLTVNVIERLKIYNVFSPNNDGQNDFWDIDFAEFFPDILVEVYARWGEKLFSSRGYTSDKRWDGTYKGKDVPIGTYYYVVVTDKNSPALTGPLTIVR